MINDKKYCLTLFLLLLVFPLFSQTKKVTFKFPYSKQRKEVVKFELINNLIIIPVSINGSDTLKFILDTGLKTSIVTHLPEGDSILINFAQRKKIKGLGSGLDLEVILSFGNEISIGSVVGKNLNFYLLTNDIFDLSTDLGMEINGVIGSDIFENFVVEINYSRRKLILHRQASFIYRRWHKRRCSYPLEIHNSKPYISLPVVTEKKDTILLKMLIDTGSSDALWVFTNTRQKIPLPEKKRYSLLGKGLNGEITGWRSRISELIICKKKMPDVSTSYPDTNAIVQSKQLDIIGRGGSLGAEILHRFDVIFDYKNNKITMRPNQYYKSPFYYNMSGIEIEQPYKELPIYIIKNVRRHSPADSAGIQVGDQLVTLNRVSTITLSLPEIYSELRKKPNKTTRLKVLRNGVLIRKKFRLIKDI